MLPDRVYTQDELLTYLEYCRRKNRAAVNALTADKAREPRLEGSFLFLEQLLQTTRHVQHHAAQLNLILRRETGSATGWVKKAKGD